MGLLFIKGFNVPLGKNIKSHSDGRRRMSQEVFSGKRKGIHSLKQHLKKIYGAYVETKG